LCMFRRILNNSVETLNMPISKTSNAPSQKRRPRGVPPKPIVEFPEPLFDEWEDPPTFVEALQLHMRRYGDTCWYLHRAITRPGEAFNRKTIVVWFNGEKPPRSVQSLEMLGRIERRYRLPPGYFKSKLPNPMRATKGHNVGAGIGDAERRRLSWHLPDDFNSLPFQKREEIIEWVRRVIISGTTEYRRFQAAAIKQRYAIRFPALTGRSVSPVWDIEDEDPNAVDPDLLSGSLDAPASLAAEMEGLVRFKTTTLTDLGFQRNGVWGEETAAQKIEHLGLMFGALSASPDEGVRGYGLPFERLTFGLLAFPGLWDWYLRWRERRRGFYTTWEVNMLSIALALTRKETGWLRQHPELLMRVRSIPGLISEAEITAASNDWHGYCDNLYRHLANRLKEIQRVHRVHRDPFEPIMCVLETDSPLLEYRKITDEILARMPDEKRHPRAAAESVRSFLLLRLGLHLGLRQKNLRQLLVCPRGRLPTTERRLEDLKCGELRWSDRDNGWEVLIPANAFKNASSSFFGQKPFRLVLPDLLDLYHYIEAYVSRHRAALLGETKDPGTFFVKTTKSNTKDATYDISSFYDVWRLTIQRYGIYNPYTGRGAIKGLLPHGPHNVRDVLATHILKKTGSYEQASYAIQDTPEMIRSHYGRFLPEDKAAIAARILNEVWMAA